MDQPQGGSKGHTLRPLLGGDTYTVELHDAMLQLHAGDGHTVLILPREEAARYLHFEWDLRRGRVVVFRLLGGLRAMRFLCPIAAANAVTAWLPWGTAGRRPRTYCLSSPRVWWACVGGPRGLSDWAFSWWDSSGSTPPG